MVGPSMTSSVCNINEIKVAESYEDGYRGTRKEVWTLASMTPMV